MLPEITIEGMPIEKGKTYNYRFTFDGCLWPGIYFVGAGISEIRSKGEFIHRVVDLLAIRIRNEEKEILQIGETAISSGSKRLEVVSERKGN